MSQPISFSGVETFPQPLAEVYAKLADAGTLAGYLPDATVTHRGADSAGWKVKPKLAFIAGELDTECTVTVRDPDVRLGYKLDCKGVGSACVVEAVLNFTPDGPGTSIAWTGAVTQMTGLLKLAPRGLLEGAAKKVIAESWAAIRSKLAG